METLILFRLAALLRFFETVEDGRSTPASKKDHALPKEITARFQEAL
ncbi:hypothetical protein [Desulfovibrio sp. MES5]|nr:hypothetical protein [Desulfovibrio sp. MES5]